MLLRGDTDDKLRWIFSLYDINQDGVVTEEDIYDVVEAIFDMLQPDVYGDDAVPEHHARTAFEV